LQAYLTEFGYLDPARPCDVDDIRAALTKFQEMNIGFHGLAVTGACDNITRLVMEMPRCGCEDIVKGDKQKMMMRALSAQNMLGPQEYRLGSTKWSKRTLKWFVEKYPVNNRHLSANQVEDAMRRGLQIWADKTNMRFEKVSGRPADIVIRFEVRRHTVQPPYYDFDGRGNVLAHAFFPESGVVHFDDDEKFTLGNNDGTELYIVAAHEFGHTLGISHSNINEALMAPYYRYSTDLQLHQDDVDAVQQLYGATETPTRAPPTRAPPTPAPTEAPVDRPARCDINIEASFKIDDTTYLFSRELLSNSRFQRGMFVYKVNYAGLTSSRQEISELFISRSSRRAYPIRVDAATYVPNRNYVFLFQGTKVYRYTHSRGRFTLDEDAGYPMWMDVSDFPERPRAAVAMPYYGSNYYYVLIFGSTMVWDWNVDRGRVGAWAYPIDAFGRNMPQRMDAAYLDSREYAIFIKGDEFWKFSVAQRRVLSGNEKLSVKREIFKGECR